MLGQIQDSNIFGLLYDLCYVYNCSVQDHFARYPAHGLLATTHLIMKHPSGDKYSFSVKWGVPAVTDRWGTSSTIRL